MVFLRSQRESQFPQVFRTLLSILADLNAVFWMVSAHSPISDSFSPLTKPLGTIPGMSITSGINVTFHSFFLKISCKVLVLVSLFVFFFFILLSLSLLLLLLLFASYSLYWIPIIIFIFITSYHILTDFFQVRLIW